MSAGRTVAIIPARGGSKGIPRKNIRPICGEPLVAWSIAHARKARGVDSVWVSSDDAEILATAERYGARPIQRPAEISGDTATSESAWLQAIESIENAGLAIDRVIGMQATSPIREPGDLDDALALYDKERCDSLLTVCEVEDFFMWRRGPNGPEGVNHDPDNRRRRQEIDPRYLENGSFYIFTPALIKARSNRLGGKIGLHVMAKHKMFQIDEPTDIALCEAIMRGYGLDRID